MIFASAQTRPKRTDIESNLADHNNMIESASKQVAELIFLIQSETIRDWN